MSNESELGGSNDASPSKENEQDAPRSTMEQSKQVQSIGSEPTAAGAMGSTDEAGYNQMRRTNNNNTSKANYNSSAGFCRSCVVSHWPVKLKIVGPITTRHQCRGRNQAARALKVIRSSFGRANRPPGCSSASIVANSTASGLPCGLHRCNMSASWSAGNQSGGTQDDHEHHRQQQEQLASERRASAGQTGTTREVSPSSPASGATQTPSKQQQQQQQCKCSIVVVNDGEEDDANNELDRCELGQSNQLIHSLHNSSHLLRGWQQQQHNQYHQHHLYNQHATTGGNRANCSRSMPSSRSMSLTHEFVALGGHPTAAACVWSCSHSCSSALGQPAAAAAPSLFGAGPHQQQLFQHPDMMRVSPTSKPGDDRRASYGCPGAAAAGQLPISGCGSPGRRSGSGSGANSTSGASSRRTTTCGGASGGTHASAAGRACRPASPSAGNHQQQALNQNENQDLASESSSTNAGDEDDDRLRREREDEFDCGTLAQIPTRFKANSISSCVRLLSGSSSASAISTPTAASQLANWPLTQPLPPQAKSCLLCDLKRHLTVVAQQQQQQQQQASIEQQQSSPSQGQSQPTGQTAITVAQPKKDYLKPGDYATSKSFNRLFPPASFDGKPPKRRHSWICR